MKGPRAYRMQRWEANLSSAQKQPRFYETQSLGHDFSLFERLDENDWDGLVLSYDAKRPGAGVLGDSSRYLSSGT